MSAPPTAPPPADAPGPAAAVTSWPTLVLPFTTLDTAPGVRMTSTKSVDVPPIWKPALAPPILIIAGGDHLPLKSLPVRQLIGPRPPVPPMPTANFFTLGRTM